MPAIQQNIGHAADRAVAQRFEAKYAISEFQADAIRDYITPYVREDANSRVYPVSSLYLDSRDLCMFWSSEMGEKNRHKLRIRWYDDHSESVFIEVKRRMNEIVMKRRATVYRNAADAILRSDCIDESMLTRPDAQGLSNLLYFRDLMETMFATPRAVVRYEREAYISDLEEPVRITFDRRLCCYPSETLGPLPGYDSKRWRHIDDFPVILEVKFTDTFPLWVKQLVRRFHLMRQSVAKYVVCVKALQREGIPVSGVSMGGIL